MLLWFRVVNVVPKREPDRCEKGLPTSANSSLWPSARVSALIATLDEIRIVHEDQVVARHQRRWGREQYCFDPIHYLAILERKPGGFDYARPLKDWRLPECFNLLRRRLEADDRHGPRAFIRILRLLEKHTLAQLTDAVEYALDLDVIDPDSVRVILDFRAERRMVKKLSRTLSVE